MEDIAEEFFEVSKFNFDANAEQEQEQGQEREVDQERGVDLIETSNGSHSKARNEDNNNVRVEEGNRNFAHFAKFESVSARDDLGALPTNRNFASGPKL
jgi:hypothetical protein